MSKMLEKPISLLTEGKELLKLACVSISIHFPYVRLDLLKFVPLVARPQLFQVFYMSRHFSYASLLESEIIEERLDQKHIT